MERICFWRGAVDNGSRVYLLLAALLAAVVLAGCGESSTPAPTSTSAVAAASPVTSTQGAVASVDAVAFVSGKPIAKSSWEHWLAVERALEAGGNPGHRALGFLVSSVWLVSEASAQGVSVSAAEVKQRLAVLKRQSFPTAGSLGKFLAKSHETEADLLGRVKVELLESRIAAKVTAGRSAAQRKSILADFQQAFQRRWKSRTTCRAGYVMEDCSEYRGKPESQTSSASTSSSASSASHKSGSSASSSSGSSAASSNGEVYSAPGAMSISSPAFERNGAIPTQYTCDGASVSPPLQWQNVPAKTAAFVLFVIDDSATGAASGIRWVVGDISPSAKGVAAGQTPEGGIVGSDTQGKSGYGGICPEHGKTSTVEFVLYALKQKIPLSPGFQPSVAESEYGSGKDLLGSAAVTYAVYHRQ
jgi:Raf kinase inhibitor-like YbhB/YbcL family protein